MTHEAICWRLPGAANEQPPTGFEATLEVAAFGFE
jgi:hypothetical protein